MQSQFGEISSPVNKECENDCKLLSTPKTNKSKNSGNPLKYSKIKKSKRRECTPAYSPPQLSEAKDESNFQFYTDKKGSFTFGKLNFDSELVLFQPNSQYKKDKTNFLELVEESLNEFNGTYLNTLESQTTPDTIFTTLFNDSKENPEKMLKNTSNANNFDFRKVYSEIEGLCSSLRNGDVSHLQSEKPQVILIDSQCNLSEISFKKFEESLIGLIANGKEARTLKENIFCLQGKANLRSTILNNNDTSSNNNQFPQSDDKYSICKEAKLIFLIEKDMKIKLTCIELHCF